jgi:hypothetical protein
MWENTVEPDRPQMTTLRMHIACWVPQATNIHPEYVILISFPRKQWLHEGSSMFHYMYIYIVCLVLNIK